jgi:hypothetical protein
LVGISWVAASRTSSLQPRRIGRDRHMHSRPACRAWRFANLVASWNRDQSGRRGTSGQQAGDDDGPIQKLAVPCMKAMN